MKAFSCHCSSTKWEQALKEVIQQVQQGMRVQPDLSFVFVSYEWRDKLEEIALEFKNQVGSKHILGCTAETVIEGNQELESQTAIAAWSITLPGAQFQTYHLEFGRIGNEIICAGFPQLDQQHWPKETGSIFMLGEPFSAAIDVAFKHIHREVGDVPVYGGMASGGYRPGQNRLVLNDQVIDSGAVGVLIQNGPRIRGIVSQGCRPIGKAYVVTKSKDNFILELGGIPVLEKLKETLDNESEQVKELVRAGLHLGVVMNEYQEQFHRGDFLVTNVLGLDSEQQALAIGNRVRVGQTVQFHVRDAETAHEDLMELLNKDISSHTIKAEAALLFSCNGRGTRMFKEQHHDAECIQNLYGNLPLAGFFAAGEFGPVSKKNYIHGFTASVVVFEPVNHD